MLFNEGHSINVAKDRCLNILYVDMKCSYCLDHCPANAISYNANGLDLNSDLCEGCGLCFQDCPTEVFTSGLWDETAIIYDIQKSGWSIIELFCGKHPAPFKKDSSQDRGAIQIPACLSAISRGAWYELGLNNKLELHLEKCETCSMKDTVSRIQFNISTASEWLYASGYTADISFITSDATGMTRRKFKAIESAVKVTSRRDFFLTFSKTIKSKAELISKKEQYSFKRNMNSLLPRWHTRLAETYLKDVRGKNETLHLAYWPIIKIKDNCSGCGMCIIVCPTKTLSITMEGETFARSFTSGLCIDCRLCQTFCPKKAIIRSREQIKTPFTPITLAIGSVNECNCCGKTIYNRMDNLCYWCKEEDKAEKNAMEHYRKLFLKTEE